MAAQREALLATAAALQAIAQTMPQETQAGVEANVQTNVEAGTQEGNGTGEEVGSSGRIEYTQDQASAPFAQELGLPAPPMPTDDQDLERISKKVSGLLRHTPRGCDFCVDGSAPLEQVARQIGIHPDLLWNMATSHPGPHRIPRWETALVEGEWRIRAAYRHSYPGFERDALRGPMLPHAPLVDMQYFRNNDTWSRAGSKQQRNYAAHQRQKMRRTASSTPAKGEEDEADTRLPWGSHASSSSRRW